MVSKGLILGLISLVLYSVALGQQFQLEGIVKDKNSKEPIVGARIDIEGTEFRTRSGLDGSFKINNIPQGNYQLKVTFISYDDNIQNVSLNENLFLTVLLLEESIELEGVNVIATRSNESEGGARADEKNSMTVINVLSAQTIELSPDISAANAIQRVSGISMERNATGDGQHAVLRGMDKRYNYTLVNGIKIPSPDNNNRYVPLDIFPSDLIGRMEVTKALTPDMEGDAIGGAVNMEMRDAPNKLMVNASSAVGYNTFFFDYDYRDFDRSVVNPESPSMINGIGHIAQIEEFPMENGVQEAQTAPISQLYTFAVGNRFGSNKKLGVLIAGSYNLQARGSQSLFYHTRTDAEENKPELRSIIETNRTTLQQRSGLNAKVDYRFNADHKISLHSMYSHLSERESRIRIDTSLSFNRTVPGTGRIEKWYRTRQKISGIFANMVQGKHTFNDKWSADWTASYSFANYDDPDMMEFIVTGERTLQSDGTISASPMLYDNTNFRGHWRRWRGNSDRDYSVYSNVTYEPELFGQRVKFKTGGMMRNKDRENYFDRYRLTPTPNNQQYTGDFRDAVYGAVATPQGTPQNALNYTLNEQIMAGYAMTQFEIGPQVQILTGVRAEQTFMSWVSNAPTNVPGRIGNIDYIDVLPSFHIKYAINEKMNLRSSYFESISRQGYFEVIPYSFFEDDQFREAGNPNLERAQARNMDIRYEWYMSALDKIMAGVFYKQIEDPIEYTVIRREDLGNDLFLSPVNLGTANNYGFEFDFVKYFKRWGVRGNYTFTLSEITTPKIRNFRDDNGMLTNEIVEETRPLQGQSMHLGNFSLLFKDQDWGTDLQLSAIYTGRRIAFVSPFYGIDNYQRAQIHLDFSAEQKLVKGFSVFVKVNNILNTPYELEILEAPVNINSDANIIEQRDLSESVVVRQDIFQRMFLIGVRYKLK
jgi:hypothetical protein